jgi:hypothetical protein
MELMFLMVKKQVLGSSNYLFQQTANLRRWVLGDENGTDEFSIALY